MSTAVPRRSTSEPRGGFLIAGEQLLLAAVPIALTAWLAFAAITRHWYALDFYRAYYPAAERLLHGLSPYAVTHHALVSGTAFVYPPLSAVAFVPFTLVNRALADHLYSLLCLLCVLGTLRAASVRDWRVYGITLLWYPMIIGWQGQNISVPLMFLVALVWRHRQRPWIAGLLTAAAISLKPLVWPLGLWLLVTRRWRAAAWTLGFGMAFNLAAWAVVGSGEIHTFLRLTAQDTDAQWRGGYGLIAVAHQLGFSRGVGEGLLVIVSAAVALMAARAGLRARQEREAMILTVVLMLVASPLVWIHYFVLLLVPLALSRPRFSAIWLVPLAMWALPSGPAVAGWQLALGWGVTVACVLSALRERPVGRWPAGLRPYQEGLPATN